MELLKKLKYLKINRVPMSDRTLIERRALRNRARLLFSINLAVRKSMVEIISNSETNLMFQRA